MNRIDKCFEVLKEKNEKAMVAFITAGDCGMEATEKNTLEMFKNGADIVGIGVPFSDPIAECGTIQEASLRSLKNGTTLDMIFDTISNIRKSTEEPIVLVMYINTIFVYGTEKFFTLCNKNGVDGVIILDMPYEEREEVQEYADKYGVYNINIVTSASGDRIKKIASKTSGFLYCISSHEDDEEFFRIVKENANCPYCTECYSFEHAKKVADQSDGVITESAVVKIMEENKCAATDKVGAFIKKLKSEIQ